MTKTNNTITSAINVVDKWGTDINKVAIEKSKLFNNNIINILKDTPKNINNAIIGTVNVVKEWGLKLTETASKAITEMKNIIISIANGIVKEMSSIGIYIVDGLISGINSRSSALYETLENMARRAIRAAERELGIASPSKVFAGIGGFMAEGLSIGFSDEMRNVEKEISRSTHSVIPDVQKQSANDKRETGGISVVQNIYTQETNYAAQQREATKQFRLIAREVFT